MEFDWFYIGFQFVFIILFVKGNLIVGYAGSDKRLLGNLAKILGSSVTK